VVVLGLTPFFQPDGTTTMSKGKRRKAAPSATPWDDVPESELTPPQALVAASHRSAYGFRYEAFDGDIAFFCFC
jgi:hypothetical protein